LPAPESHDKEEHSTEEQNEHNAESVVEDHATGHEKDENENNREAIEDVPLPDENEH
jgi:hypothetical protein